MGEVEEDTWKGPVPQESSRKPLALLSRCEWSAVPPKWSEPLDLPVTKVFVASTGRRACFGTRQCSGELQRLQNYQMKVDSIPDIRYNFVISPTGTVYECKGWKMAPNLPHMYAPLNSKSLYIAFSGNYRDPKIPIPIGMLESMELLLQLGVEYKYIAPDYEAFDI